MSVAAAGWGCFAHVSQAQAFVQKPPEVCLYDMLPYAGRLCAWKGIPYLQLEGWQF